jgi:hypothetical protein
VFGVTAGGGPTALACSAKAPLWQQSSTTIWRWARLSSMKYIPAWRHASSSGEQKMERTIVFDAFAKIDPSPKF